MVKGDTANDRITFRIKHADRNQLGTTRRLWMLGYVDYIDAFGEGRLGVFVLLKSIQIRRIQQAHQLRWSTLFYGTLAFLALFGFLHLLAGWLHPSH